MKVDRQPILQIILLIFTCIWGSDYLIGPPRSSLHAVELHLPLTPLGVFLLSFGVMGLIGELWMEAGRNRNPPTSGSGLPYLCRAKNRWWPAFIAYTALGAMCMGLTAGSLAEMVINEHFWGGRMPAGMFMIGCLYMICAERRKRVP